MVSPLIPDTGVLLQLHTHNKLQKCVLELTFFFFNFNFGDDEDAEDADDSFI